MNVEALIWQDGWVPTNDTEVSQILKYLSDKAKETRRVVSSAQEEIQMLSQVGEQAQESYNKLESRVAHLLERYVLEEVDEEDRKETKTTIKYKLARGEIVVNKASVKIEKPTEADEVCLSAEFPNFVKSEPKFQWGEFKKELELSEDGKVIFKPTGKEVSSVPVVETPLKTSIKLTL